jgi:protein TonB
MFRETLLESSPQSKKRRRWPMAAALALQMIATALLIVIPMLTTGVIPVAARTVVFTPTNYRPPEPVRPNSGMPGGRPSGPTAEPRVVQIFSNSPNQIHYGAPVTPGNPEYPVPDLHFGSGNGPVCPRCLEGDHGTGVVPSFEKPRKPLVVSVLSEAQLINKVVPTYPMLARRTGIQGDVKLHAIISRDGSIQSLSLISGHPLLTGAAVDAVEQWRYRPYILNGEAVEVETWITVSFKKNN